MNDKMKYIALFVFFGLVFMLMLLLKPDYPTKEELQTRVPKSTNIQDVYLVYKLWFDEDWNNIN